MSMFKKIQEIESDIFDVLHDLHVCLQYKNASDYKMNLQLLDILNEEYKDITTEYYIKPEKVLDYHSRQWEL